MCTLSKMELNSWRSFLGAPEVTLGDAACASTGDARGDQSPLPSPLEAALVADCDYAAAHSPSSSTLGEGGDTGTGGVCGEEEPSSCAKRASKSRGAAASLSLSLSLSKRERERERVDQ